MGASACWAGAGRKGLGWWGGVGEAAGTNSPPPPTPARFHRLACICCSRFWSFSFCVSANFTTSGAEHPSIVWLWWSACKSQNYFNYLFISRYLLPYIYFLAFILMVLFTLLIDVYSRTRLIFKSEENKLTEKQNATVMKFISKTLF